MIEDARVRRLNRHGARSGGYVLYWMQASQRAEYNHALEYAAREANAAGKPLVAFFGLTRRFPEANRRHYHFMLEGLAYTQAALRARGIALVVHRVSPEIGAVRMARQASMVVTDRGYLRIQRQWREHVAGRIACPLVQVETDVVVPVEEASAREEYSAATLRPKIMSRLTNYLRPVGRTGLRKDSLGPDFGSVSIEDVARVVSALRVDRSVEPVTELRGGTGEARRHLRAFVEKRLDGFAELRSDPARSYLSNLSPYLHFGQISPVYAAMRVLEARSPSGAAFIEEMVVRRELSMNFALYNPMYDAFAGLPAWAKATLAEHKRDPRKYEYSETELEEARTHDPYWNAAQDEMRLTGKMHGYMRMYWGKKILEWSPTPERAYKTAIDLNNKYELDGRDPNSYAGVAWCFGKHDRPWPGRKIFGTVRYMVASGLERKFDMEAYLARVAAFSKGGGK
jgi:deoxyribodipyrimidine photo-lyase